MLQFLCGALLPFVAGTVPTDVLQLQSRVVDLRAWGYTAPPDRGSLRGEFYSSRLISVSKDANSIAGFVTREAESLASRNRPTLVLHVVRLDGQGKLLVGLKFPTTMWDDNQIFAVSAGNLLIRTPDALTLYSESGKELATKNLADPHTQVRMFPNREGVVVQRHDGNVEVLSTRDLSTIKSCSYSDWEITSVSNHNFVIRRPVRLTEPLPYHLQVAQLCGPAQFEYRWRVPSGFPRLLDDTRFVIYAGSQIQLVDRDTPRWLDSFGKGESVRNVEADEKGKVLGVAVPKYVGGSTILDINGHLKHLKIMVYRAADGYRLAEVTVEHPPRLIFDFFAVSPDGSMLAILSNGFLQIVQIPAQ